MVELEFLGPDKDSGLLVFTDKQGQRYSVPIDEELRAALRPNSPHIDLIKDSKDLRPRQIQMLLRSGTSAEDIASEYNLPLAQIRTFEGPILAERAHIIAKAQEVTIGTEPDSPHLGDLAIDRLATRGVDPANLSWDATRLEDKSWQIVLHFVQAATQKSATWSLSNSGSALTALDQEARWLSETTAPAPLPGVAYLTGTYKEASENDQDLRPSSLGERDRPQWAIRATSGTTSDAFVPTKTDPPLSLLENTHSNEELPPRTGAQAMLDPHSVEASPSEADTHALLDELAANRGTPQMIDFDDLDEDGHPCEPASSQTESAQVLDLNPNQTLLVDQPQSPTAEVASSEPMDTGATPKRRRRRSVPSWDEIVFGAKPQ